MLDRVVTETTQHGQYVVYLFAPLKRKVYLSLNQGTTEMYEAFGQKKGRQQLKERARVMRAVVLSTGQLSHASAEIALGEDGDLPRGYEAGHALGFCYDIDALPTEDVLRSDLLMLLNAYQHFILSFDFAEDEVGESFTPGNTISSSTAYVDPVLERRRYVTHSRIERRSDVSKKVKRLHAPVCAGCGVDFTTVYGPLGYKVLEVHHLKPLSSLDLGVQVKYDLREDFAVLCANCHRMIHRLNDPADLQGLRKLIGDYSLIIDA